MRLREVVDASAEVAATRSRLAKVAALAALLGRADAAALAILVPWLAGELRQGKIGVGWAQLREAAGAPPAEAPSLGLADVDAALAGLGALAGPGSVALRRQGLRALLARADAEEQAFLLALLSGELRQGALAGVLADAAARATGTDPARMRRAAMLSGDLVAPVIAAFAGGEAALAAFDLELFRPVQPMLADTAESAADALAALGPGPARLEQKLDGARIQVHRAGEVVRVFTRALLEVTDAVPEVVALARALPAREVVLDGEVLARDAAGRPRPFQVTMRRFGRKNDVEALRAELPLHPVVFDVLRVDGRVLLDEPLAARIGVLDGLVPADHRMVSLTTADPAEAEAFLRDTLAAGHEGVMAKAPDSPYEAGHRGARWLKLKPAWTVDLLVIAVEWGSGRRSGLLSNLHLAARDPDTGAPVMLGKTFKGLTDELLAWQTAELLAREVARDGHVVRVRPELVVEVAFQDVQASPRYPAGMALRLARVVRYRPDKRPEDADDLARIRAIFLGRAAR